MVVELHGKRLALLHEAVPAARRVAALLQSPSRTNAEKEHGMRAAAASAGLELSVFPVGGAGDYTAAFAAMRAVGAQALVIGSSPEFSGDAAMLAAA